MVSVLRVPARCRFLGRRPLPPACRTAFGVVLFGSACAVSACRGAGRSRSACPEGMVPIPAGTFEMGSDIPEADPDEKPVHRVTLSAFCMDRTEVTLDAYDACVKSGKCKAGGGTGLYSCGKMPEHSGRPVNCVTW